VIGRVAAKFLIAALLGTEALLLSAYFKDGTVTGFLALGAVCFVLDATLFWRNRAYGPKEMPLFLWGWNIAVVLGMFWNWTESALTHVNPATRVY
jgi:hypothetical protein